MPALALQTIFFKPSALSTVQIGTHLALLAVKSFDCAWLPVGLTLPFDALHLCAVGSNKVPAQWTCVYDIYGCTDPGADNYESFVTVSCAEF